jgi:hypothetical protein
VGKARIGVAGLRHLALELFVGHAGGLAVYDPEVGHGDFLGGGVAVGQCRIENEASTCGMPFFRLVFLLCILRLDVVELLALELILMLGLLGGAGDAGRKGLEDVGGVHQGGGVGARGRNAREDVLMVETGAPVCELAIVGGDQESRLVNLALVDSDAPEGKEINVGIDVALVKFLFSLMLADVLLLSCLHDDDQRKGGKGVQCKNRIAKEGSGEEA